MSRTTRSRQLTALCLLSAALSGPVPGSDQPLPGHVLRVIDGDSLVLDVNGGQYRIELAGIDAPELSQPWGSSAAQWLHRALTGRFIVVTGETSGGGAVTGSVTFKGRDIALDLLHDGLAWSTVPVDPQLPSQHPYADAQAAARAARRGLWSDDDPVPPWEWRERRPPLEHQW